MLVIIFAVLFANSPVLNLSCTSGEAHEGCPLALMFKCQSLNIYLLCIDGHTINLRVFEEDITSIIHLY